MTQQEYNTVTNVELIQTINTNITNSEYLIVRNLNSWPAQSVQPKGKHKLRKVTYVPTRRRCPVVTLQQTYKMGQWKTYS